MSLFAAALRLTGLSQPEAADWLSDQLCRSVSLQTIKDMSSGRSKAHPDVWAALSSLHQQQLAAADEALDLIDELADAHGEPPESLDFGSYGRASEWPSLRVAENTAALVALQSGIPAEE